MIQSHCHLYKALQTDPSTAVRREACEALGALGDPAAVPALLKLLHSSGRRAPGHSRPGTGTNQGLPGRAALAGTAPKRPGPNGPHHLAAQTGNAAAALAESLRDSDREMRHYAARALLFFNDPATLPALRQACKDPDAEVRAAARLTLRRIERLQPKATNNR